MSIIETVRLGAEEGVVPLSKYVLSKFLSDSLGAVPDLVLDEARWLVQAMDEDDFKRGLHLCSCIEKKMETIRKIPLETETWMTWVGIGKAYFEHLQRGAGIGLT